MAKIETLDRAAAVTLPDNVHWPGEFSGWRPANQATKTALDGTPITQTTALKGGRPIVLVDFWLKRQDVEILYAWAATGEQYYLTLPDAREFLIVFADDSPLEASPVFEDAAPTAETLYLVTFLRTMTQPV